MSFRVHLTRRAERDVDLILNYLGSRSAQGAAAWASRFEAVLSELAHSASREQLAPENEDHDEEIRHVIFRTRRGLRYRAIFVIRDELVLLTHVRGPGQDIVPPEEMPAKDKG